MYVVIPTPAEHDFTFTGVNKVKSKTTPLNEVTRYNYDADRRLTNVTLPSGKQINNVYSAGKLQKTITPEHETLYAYVNGNQLKTITQNAESLSYQYDGDLVTGIDYAGVLDAGIAQGYDANFWMNSLSYAGASTAISYDNDGLLTGINGYAITRHAQHGLPTQLTDNKLAQTFSYNGYGESNVVTNKVNSKRTYDYSLSYNLIGQIIGKTETLSDGTVNNFEYGYDQRSRLISVKQNSTVVEAYTYDANGNRLTQSNSLRDIQNQTSTHNLGDQITSDGQSSFEYDGDGRLSKKTTGDLVEEYSYSSEGKLLDVVFKENALITKTINYQHNALGNRVAKLVDNVIIEKYLWLNKTTLLATYDKDDNLKQRFEYGLSHTPVSFTQAGSKYYISSDHLGSPRVITDESGNVIKAVDYDSFGNVILDSNEGLEIPFGFAGGLKDSDTGLLRFGYRDYDTQTGRWTARDPIGFAGGDSNLYGYVASDPVNFVDPTGEVGVPGALISLGVNVALQLVQNGGNISQINVGEAVLAGVTGFFIPGMGAVAKDVVQGLNGEVAAAAAGALIRAISGLVGESGPYGSTWTLGDLMPSVSDLQAQDLIGPLIDTSGPYPAGPGLACKK